MARTLAQMHNYPTCYEVAIDGVVVAYTACKTKSALLRIAQDNADTIIAKLPADDAPITYKAGAWHFGPVVVKFTGRTERDAALS